MQFGGFAGPSRASASGSAEAPSASASGAQRSRFTRHTPAPAPACIGPEHNAAPAEGASASSSAGGRYGSYHTGLGPLAGLINRPRRRHVAGGVAAATAASLTALPQCRAPLTALPGLRATASVCRAAAAASGSGSAAGADLCNAPLAGGLPLRLRLTRCHAFGARGGQGGGDSDGEASSSLSGAKINCSECGEPLRLTNVKGHFERGCRKLPAGVTEDERSQLIRQHEKKLRRANGLDGDGGGSGHGMLPSRSARTRRTDSRSTMVMLRDDNSGSCSGSEDGAEGQGEAERRQGGRGAPGASGAPGSVASRSRNPGHNSASGTGVGSSSDANGTSSAAAGTARSRSGSSTGAAEASSGSSRNDAGGSASGNAVPAAAGASKRSTARSSPSRWTRPASADDGGGAGTSVLDRPPGPSDATVPGSGDRDGPGAAAAAAGGAPLRGDVLPLASQADMNAGAALADLQLPVDAAAVAGLTQADGLLPQPLQGSPSGSPPGSPPAASTSRPDWLKVGPVATSGGGAGRLPAPSSAPSPPAAPLPSAPTASPVASLSASAAVPVQLGTGPAVNKPAGALGTWNSMTVTQHSRTSGAGSVSPPLSEQRDPSKRTEQTAAQPRGTVPGAAAPAPPSPAKTQPPARGHGADTKAQQPAQPQAQGPGQEPDEGVPVPVLDPVAVAAEAAHVDNGLTGSRRAMAVAGVEASARRAAPVAAPASTAGPGTGRAAGTGAGGQSQDNEVALREMMTQNGGLQGRTKKVYKTPFITFHNPPGFDRNDPYFTSLTPEALTWLRHTRRISDDVIRAARLYVEPAPPLLDKASGRQVPRLALCFPYFVHGRIVNVKKRFFVPEWAQPFSKKDFRLGYGCELVAYGHDDLMRHIAAAGGGGAVTVVVVEGEMDKLALNTVGYWNVVSVPNGAALAKLNPANPDAPPRQQFSSEPDRAAAEEARYYSWLESLLRLLPDPAKAVFVLATDTDTAGRGLRAELMRRLGRERCWEVTSWDNEFLVNALGQLGAPAGGEDAMHTPAPHSNGATYGAAAGSSASSGEGHSGNGNGAAAAASGSSAVDTGRRKDANDVLVLDGPERLARLLAEEARPAKLRGLATFREYEEALTSYYLQEDPLALGVSTGWPSLDKYYRVAPGELTIVTGIPNSGKSEFLDALLVNLAENHGWAFAMCSLEKGPVPHLKALIEKRMRKPFKT